MTRHLAAFAFEVAHAQDFGMLDDKSAGGRLATWALLGAVSGCGAPAATDLGGRGTAPASGSGSSDSSSEGGDAPAQGAPAQGTASTLAEGGVDAPPTGAVGLAPGSYLVAIDTPTRTYLDYVQVPQSGTWRPDVNGWPQLAQWENQTTAKAIRFQAFVPGDTLSPSAIMALLPITAPARQTLDITAAPYGAKVSPADATTSIQAALNAAQKMATPQAPVDVIVPAGTYQYSAVLSVGANVRLRGEGGMLQATNQANGSVHLTGDGSGALFLTVKSNGSVRGSTMGAAGIWVGPSNASGAVVHNTLVVGNEVIQPSGAHIFAIAEEGGIWAFNYAHDGFADTFHHTGGSSFCQVIGNRASESATRGDDFYAFVGYAKDGDPVHHCSCIANEGSDGPSRGLAAVGAGYIDFQDNVIARTQHAGIYVASESSYDTFGSFSVLVVRDHITSANLGGSGHDGLLAFADNPTATNPSHSFGSVPNEIRNLTVEDSSFADIATSGGNGYGIEVRTSCQGGEIMDNTVTDAASPGVVVRGTGFTVSSNTFTP
jgi:hypothetical protein